MRSTLLILGLSTGLFVPAFGQATLYTIKGTSANAGLGINVANAGDVNMDGFDDVIVGAPGAELAGAMVGNAQVVSGKNGLILHTFWGSFAGAGFGGSVDGISDINGDGHGDLIVSATGEAAAMGTVYVFSGMDGSTLFTLPGRGPNDFFGLSVSGVGDVSGDGIPDFGVGALGFDPVGPDVGMIEIYSGATGAVVWTLDGSPDDTLGASLDGVGDLNSDGFDDFVVGAPGIYGGGALGGQAQVISGATGLPLFTWTAPALYTSSAMGNSVAGAGDVNQDGIPDVLVGNYAAGGPGFALESGEVTLFSGIDGSVLRRWIGRQQGDMLGWSVDGAGDVDGDGFLDVILGAPGIYAPQAARGEVRIYSVASGSELHTLQGPSFGSGFGSGVAGNLDLNHDGFADFAIGAKNHSGSALYTGQATIHAGHMVPVTSFSYCVSSANSTGEVAHMQAIGNPFASANQLILQVTEVPGGMFAIFMGSRGQASVQNPGGSAGTLCLGGTQPIARFLDTLGATALGQYHAPIDLTNVPEPPTFLTTILGGETWHFQAWYRDGSANNFSNAIGVTFQ